MENRVRGSLKPTLSLLCTLRNHLLPIGGNTGLVSSYGNRFVPFTPHLPEWGRWGPRVFLLSKVFLLIFYKINTAYVHVAHDVIIGDGCIFSNNATLAGHVVVDSYAIVGGLTPIHQFCRIGSYSMTGGASAVNQDICPFILAEGNKAIPRGLNSVGLRRRGFTDEEISRLKKAYKIVFRSGLPLKDALAQIEAEIEQDKNITYFVDFIKNSNRGIAR